jgi:uncharacterized membrane protein
MTAYYFLLQAPAPGNWALFIGRSHPLLVHLPIGILLVVFILEWLGRKPGYSYLQSAIPPVLFAGVLAAVASCIAGYLLSAGGGYEESLLSWHKWLGISVAVVSLLLWIFKKLSQATQFYFLKKWMLPLSGVMVLLLSAAGHYGGSLTHGSDYLTQAMPVSLRQLTGAGGAVTAAGPVIENVADAKVYEAIVQPILSQKCYSCHNTEKRKGGLRLDDSTWIAKGGEHGAALKPGVPLQSEIFKRMMLSEEDEKHMPPKGKPQLSLHQAALLEWWIASGAPFNKQVKELSVPANIKPMLAALEASSGSDGQVDIPASEVSVAAAKDMHALESRDVKVMPVGASSNYLQLNFVNAAAFSDKDIHLLLPLKQQIAWLKLGNTQITDASLKTIRQLPNLTRLHLEHTAVTDTGMQELAGNRTLRYLNLFGTRVTDHGLSALQQVSSLQRLYLYKTAISAKAILALKEHLPKLQVDTGGYVLDRLPTDTIIYHRK